MVLQKHRGMKKHDNDLGNSVKLLVLEQRSPLQEWAVRPRHQAKECVFLIVDKDLLM